MFPSRPNIRLDNVYHKIIINLPFWIAAGIAALVAVAFAKVFAICEDWALSHAATQIILITAPLGILTSFLIGHFFSKEALGSGIPQIIAAVEVKDDDSPLLKRLLGFPMLVAKILGACVCVLGGGSTGREGPTLQVSAAIFYKLSRWWPKNLPKPQQNLMILAGGAGGLAAAFNTPLGGVVFAMEELSKTHINVVRTSVFQAVLIAGIISQMLLGNYLYLGHQQLVMSEPFRVIAQTFLIAIVVGLISAFFSEMLYRIGRYRNSKTFTFKVMMTIFCGLAFSAIIYFCGPSTIGGGKKFMADLLADPTNGESILIPMSRIFGNFFTYISGVIGGVFAPALASGAAIAQFMTLQFGFVSPRMMILVGMVSFLTGVTRSPFTSFVLVLEMSDSHEMILYLMLSSFISSLVARLVNTKSFYEQAAHDIQSVETGHQGQSQKVAH